MPMFWDKEKMNTLWKNIFHISFIKMELVSINGTQRKGYKCRFSCLNVGF